jgi:YHS domain-containing protein
VTPAQAYGTVPPAAAAGQSPPLSDPYAQQPATAPAPATAQASPVANPYAPPAAPVTPPAVNPYEAHVAPAANPYTAQPPVGQPPMAGAPTANTYAAAPPVQAPAAALPAAANPYAAPPQYVAQASVAPQVQLPPIPPGCPPLALEGNCPVTLVERKRWAVGHPTFGAVHRGRTYLFLGPQEREKFLADPDRFSPVLSGLDPVHAIDNRVSAPGKREFGVFGADGKIYLFADEASRVRFEQNEQHYTTAVNRAMQQPTYQAMRPNP